MTRGHSRADGVDPDLAEEGDGHVFLGRRLERAEVSFHGRARRGHRTPICSYIRRAILPRVPGAADRDAHARSLPERGSIP
jgi:hypothetical protein